MIMTKTISVALLSSLCTDAFKVHPERSQIFKNIIETSVKHPVMVPKESRSVPMIQVFDDNVYSPHTQWFSNLLSAQNYTSAARPLSEIFHRPFIPTKEAKQRRQFGCDDHPAEYWFDNRIHSFGNTGFWGAIHAIVAPVATTMIDLIAYERINVRNEVSKHLSDQVINKAQARVLDLCCGVGISTRALKQAFHDAEAVIGIDTSPEMVFTARGWTRHDDALGKVRAFFSQVPGKEAKISEKLSSLSNMYEFARGNAERTIFPDKSFDLVTIMYGFHEIPKMGRYRILREVRRVLEEGGTLALIDIAPEYEPSESMLMGEPYVLEYKQNIMEQMSKIRGFTNLRYKALIPGHVSMWILERKSSITFN